MTRHATTKLNSKESKVLAAFCSQGRPAPKTISDLAATCFPKQSDARANSWTRNSLRRLVKCAMLEGVDRGTYEVTDLGREYARVEALVQKMIKKNKATPAEPFTATDGMPVSEESMAILLAAADVSAIEGDSAPAESAAASEPDELDVLDDVASVLDVVSTTVSDSEEQVLTGWVG